HQPHLRLLLFLRTNLGSLRRSRLPPHLRSRHESLCRPGLPSHRPRHAARLPRRPAPIPNLTAPGYPSRSPSPLQTRLRKLIGSTGCLALVITHVKIKPERSLMATVVKITTIGNSVGIVLPKEVLN